MGPEMSNLMGLWWTQVLFWDHWYPCIGFLVTSPLGFKARVGSALFAFFCGGKCNIHSPRSISGATRGNLLAVNITASHFPKCISKGGTWLGFEWPITQTVDERPTIVPATRHHVPYLGFKHVATFARSDMSQDYSSDPFYCV